MNTALKIACLGMMFGSVPVVADDAPSAPPIKSYKQKMDACMDRQRTANPTMSKHDSKKACGREIAAMDNRPSVPPSPALVPVPP